MQLKLLLRSTIGPLSPPDYLCPINYLPGYLMPYTSPRKHSRILLLRKDKLSYCAIADTVGIASSTVYDVVKRSVETDDCYGVKPKQGRLRIFMVNDAGIAVRKIATTECCDATDVQCKMFPRVSPATVRHALEQEGLKACIPRSKPLITITNIKKRWIWSFQHIEWTEEDWQQVVFSDKSKFNLVGSDGCRYVWRKPGQELDKRFVKKNVKHGGGSIMVWGCVTSKGVGRLRCIDWHIMDSAVYIDILNN